MNHSAFFKQIKDGGLSGAYILHGEEEYVKDKAVQSVISTVEEAVRDLNVQILETAEAQTLIELCETLPFFASRRLVICRALPKDEAWKRLEAYLPTMPQTTLLLFVIRGAAPGTLGIMKYCKAHDRIVLFDVLDENEAVRWVCQQCVSMNVSITQACAHFLVRRAGTPLGNLSNELIKAASYAGDGNEITNDVILRSVTPNIEYGVFSMMDYFLSGKSPDGLRALGGLLETESAFAIAALMAGRFKLMLQCKIYAGQGMDKNSAAAKIGGSPYAAKSAYDAAKRYTKESLMKNITAFSDVAYKQMSGQMKDRDALELAVLHCAPDYM